MREILFRGKRIDNGEWVEGYYLFHKVRNKHIILSIINDVDKFIEVAPETVGQFTGLTDKNGMKIFEGDICKCRYYKHSEKDLYLTQKVVFEHSAFFVVTEGTNPCIETDTYTNCPLNWVNEIEVINNTELLK